MLSKFWPAWKGLRLVGAVGLALVLALVLAACDSGSDSEGTPVAVATNDGDTMGSPAGELSGEVTGTLPGPDTALTAAPIGGGVTTSLPITDSGSTQTGTVGTTDTTTGDTGTVMTATAQTAGEQMTTTTETDSGEATATPPAASQAPESLPETGQQVTSTVGVTDTAEMTETQDTNLAPGTEGHSVAPVAQPGGDLGREVDIQLVKVADGLVDPINVVIPPDGSGRLFVVERPGRVRIVQDGQVLDEPFIDISDLVVSAFLEQGLYDLAFHPDFANNGKFYLHFSELMRNGDSVIVEYQVSADDENLADRESGQVIMLIEQPWANHNGGEIEFGPDGYLYIGSGDGGWEGDPLAAGQSLSTLLGKILRIDVDVPALETSTGTSTEESATGSAAPMAWSGRPYAIPADNPFVRPDELVLLFGVPESEFAAIHTQVRPEIWAYGLRNPWKFNFDPETGDLYIADVGQNHWEEINFQPADSRGGENYGWDILMGTRCFPITETDCNEFGVLPVAEYSHALGLAVVGLGVYRGTEAPEWDGIYFVGDWGSGRIWGLARDEQDEWQLAELLDTDLHITGAGQDEDGNIFVTSCECEYSGAGPFENPPGAVWRLVPADQVEEGAETAPVGGAGEGTDDDSDSGPSASATPGVTGTVTPSGQTSPLATGTPAATGTVTTGDEVRIELSAENSEFDTESITIPAGAHVVIVFTNEDSVAHNFAVYETSEAQDVIFRGGLVTGPGETITYEFDAPTEPGTYWFQCDPHAFTMNGQFIVEQ